MNQITEIQGQGYWIRKWDISLEPDKVYRVAQNKRGEFGCNCQAWKYRRQECHHIKTLKQTLGADHPAIILAQPISPNTTPKKPVWVAVRHKGQAMRLKANVVADSGQSVIVASLRTQHRFEVPANLVFAKRPAVDVLQQVR